VKTNKNFSIVIPVFNEEKNIINLLREIYSTLENEYIFEIILVNDCSTDSSSIVISNFNKTNLKLINNDKNMGQSYAIWKGIKIAKFDTIITLDGDGQNNPQDIPNLLEGYFKDQKIFLVSGIRYKRKDSITKIISSKIANFIRSKILKDDCIDTGCSLKVFKKDIFLSLPFFDGIHRFIPALFLAKGSKNLYLKVDHRSRIHGESQYGNLSRGYKGVRDIFKVLKIIKKIKQNK